MKTINWDETGSSIEIVQTINSSELFTVLVKGQLAQAFISVLGVHQAAISPEAAKVLITLTVVLALSGLALFALARGYKVSGKAKIPNGQEYEIIFEPKVPSKN